MELDDKNYLYVLFLIPILVAVFLYNQFWKRKKQLEFGDLQMVTKLAPEKSIFKPWLKFVTICIAIIGLIMALVNPKIGTKSESVKREGIDIVFAVDVSKSMLCEDIAPNRLEKSKQLVSQIITQLQDDRIGVVAYAGSAFPVLPITTDFSVAKMFVQSMNPDMVSSQGTNLDEAIKLSARYFDDPKTSKLLIMITDGDDHSEGAEAAAAEANKLGIRILTIGVGTEAGGQIPIKENGRLIEYKKDNNGEIVITKRDAAGLTKISKATDGRYADGNNTKEVVDFVNETIKGTQKTQFSAMQQADFQSQFQWFLGLAFVLLLLDIFFLERKTSWVQGLDLFNEEKTKRQ
jgi:Ca-activated chloride channel family protein